MLTEFSQDKTRKPLVTYAVILAAVILTTINIITNNYDDFLLTHPIFRSFLLPFHHGFDFESSILHLVFSGLFFYFIGTPVEKILGSLSYLIIVVVSYLTYVAIQYLFDISGYGLTPLVFTLMVFAFATMLEAKNIKSRVVHEPYYTRLNSICVAFLMSSALLFSFLPVFYDITNTHLIRGVFEGNFLHIVMSIFGLIVLVSLRRKIKMNWLSFNRQKLLSKKPKNKKAIYVSMLFPIGIILALLI